MEAKYPSLGGIKGVVVPDPEVQIIEQKSENDWVLIGCDGVFDVLSNEEIGDIVWQTIEFY